MESHDEKKNGSRKRSREEMENDVESEAEERGEREEDGDVMDDIMAEFEEVIRVPVNDELSNDEILRMIDVWKAMWVIENSNTYTSYQILQRAERLFRVESENDENRDNLGSCKEYLTIYTETLQTLRTLCETRGLFECKDDDDRLPAEREAYFELILNGIVFGYEIRSNILRIKHLTNSQCMHAIPPTFESIQRMVMDPSEKKMDDTCLYVKFLYLTAWQRLYRIKEEMLYAPIFHNGYYTYAWKKEHDIDSFIWNAFQPRARNEKMWSIITSRPSVSTQAKKQLMQTQDPMLPKLTQYQGSWSFSNGVYVGRMDNFHLYGSESISFFNKGFATVKYFNVPFEHEKYEAIMYGGEEEEEELKGVEELKGDEEEEEEVRHDYWMNLKSPNIDKILNDQELSPDVIHWVWVFIGRLLFPVGLLDSWQVMPFFEGIAGSGKSTLLKVIQMLFNPEDVGVISDRIEKDFGAEGLYLKKIILGYDIGKNLGLSQVEWQSWVSGEAATIKRKNRVALSITNWTVPMAYAGNNIPMWNDNAGSVSRRFMIIEMLKAVRKNETTLYSKIGNNIAMVLKKMINAYLSAVDEYGTHGLWNVVPQPFRDSANRLRKATNALYAFVDSPLVITTDMNASGQQPVLYQSLESFEMAYQQFCRDKRYPFRRLEPDYVCDVFARFGIRIENGYTPPNGEAGEYLIGCRLLD